MSGSGDERALSAMVEELRAEPTPELDWERLEGRLMTQIEQSDERRDLRARLTASPVFRWVAIAAAAACLAIGGATVAKLANPGESPAIAKGPVDASAVALAPGEAGARGEHDALALHVGDVIEASSAPIAFNAPGVVSWTLAPGSRAVVRTLGLRGVGHTVALERGSLHAEVVPRDQSKGIVESFRVEVEQTRVAVHGTAFTVTRDDASVHVDVEHGEVAVGPAAPGDVTVGPHLIGPARGSFSLDGGKTARYPDRVEAPVAQRDPAAPDAQQPAAPAAPTGPTASGKPHAIAARPVEAPAPSSAPAAAPAPLTPAIVSSRLHACLERTSQGSSSVEVSITSSLHLALDADGSVRSARFVPPIAPDLQQCAVGAIAGRFADGNREITIPVSVRFGGR